MPPASLDGLPTELYPQIAIYLSLFDVLNVTRVSRRIRSSLRNPAFGKRFLEQDASNLHFEVVLATPVSGLDAFELGIATAENQSPEQVGTQSLLSQRTYFLRRRSDDNGDVHYIRVSPSGTFRTWSESLPHGSTKCIATPPLEQSGGLSRVTAVVTEEHREACSLCRQTRAAKIMWWVDKHYRVFFQSWTDSYVLGEQETVQISVIHQDDVSTWAFGGEAEGPKQFPPAKVQVLRYGLAQWPGRGKGLERFFGLDCDATLALRSDPFPSSSSSSSSEPLKIYNPWA
ncbi:hypothetical protein HDU86_005382 [Geranomyces michiganensis]|nr:hypothetical protein HDU86_005382 [Geranomyces michiganensis]